VFGKGGPSFSELVQQALSSTERGYDLIAPKFETTPFCTPVEVIERTLADLGAVGSALDLCCGTGVALPLLRELASERVVGMDFSQGMLDEARKKIGSLSAKPRMELVRSDVLALPASASFDLITCFGAFGHILAQDEPRFLAGIRGALRPGGRFVFATTDTPATWSKEHVVGTAFNAVMRVRNFVIKPPFIMYYLTFMAADVERTLPWYGFEVKVERGIFAKPYDPLVQVIATKR